MMFLVSHTAWGLFVNSVCVLAVLIVPGAVPCDILKFEPVTKLFCFVFIANIKSSCLG